MLLRSKQTVNHVICGLTYTNQTADAIDFINDLCPKCRQKLQLRDITGGQVNQNKWLLHPPQGMRFCNEMGGEVSLQFEHGREVELFQHLTAQLNTYVQAAVKAEENLRIIEKETPKLANESTKEDEVH